MQHFLVGAAPTSLEKLKEAISVFGPVMTEAFGQSEAPAAITAKAPWDYRDASGNIIESRLQGIGRACVHNQVAILDDDGKEVVIGEAGEICVRGALLHPGYHKDFAATAGARGFGFHPTGVVRVMDRDGFVTDLHPQEDMEI